MQYYNNMSQLIINHWSIYIPSTSIKSHADHPVVKIPPLRNIFTETATISDFVFSPFWPRLLGDPNYKCLRIISPTNTTDESTRGRRCIMFHWKVISGLHGYDDPKKCNFGTLGDYNTAHIDHVRLWDVSRYWVSGHTQ